MHLLRGDATLAIAKAPHRLKLRFDLGGQEQFYLEGQISYAMPVEDGGMKLWCSTQHPSEMQHLVAHALGRPAHAVQVECRRMGGGFGGKESQCGLFACVAAVAALRSGKPVKLRVDRDDDFLITGRRHCFHYEVEVGFDDSGRILGAEVTHGLARRPFGRPVGAGDDARAVPLRQCLLAAGCGRARLFGARPTRRATPPSAASAARRARSPSNTPSTASPAGWSWTRWTCAAPTSTARRAHNVTPYGQVVDDNIIHELVAELEGEQRLPRAPPGHRRLQRSQPGAEEGHRADAGEVRHQLQRHAPQPGRAHWCTSTPTAACS